MENDTLPVEEKTGETQLIVSLLQDIQQTSKSTFHWVRAVSIVILTLLSLVILSPLLLRLIMPLFFG
jgi:hypothetical protein